MIIIDDDVDDDSGSSINYLIDGDVDDDDSGSSNDYLIDDDVVDVDIVDNDDDDDGIDDDSYNDIDDDDGSDGDVIVIVYNFGDYGDSGTVDKGNNA